MPASKYGSLHMGNPFPSPTDGEKVALLFHGEENGTWIQT